MCCCIIYVLYCSGILTYNSIKLGLSYCIRLTDWRILTLQKWKFGKCPEFAFHRWRMCVLATIWVQTCSVGGTQVKHARGRIWGVNYVAVEITLFNLHLLHIWQLFDLFWDICASHVRNVINTPTCSLSFVELFFAVLQMGLLKQFADILLGAWQETFWKMSGTTDSEVCVLSYSPSAQETGLNKNKKLWINNGNNPNCCYPYTPMFS